MDKPFRSDGCSVVADYDQQECCVRHDWLYWQGGPFSERRKADDAFRKCIQANSKAGWLGPVRWFGVRIGGVSFLPFGRFRWGYGWKWPRFKAPENDDSPYTLETEQQAFEKALEAARAHDQAVREKKKRE